MIDSKRLGSSSVFVPKVGMGLGIGGFRAVDAVYEAHHLEALKYGIGLGMSFIDAAAEYGRGGAERLINRLSQEIKTDFFIATKFSPKDNAPDDVIRSAEESLTRLGREVIDLYQLHWPNPDIPLADTVGAMERLVEQGKVRFLGLSNCSIADLQIAQSALTRTKLVSVQCEMNLFDPTTESDIMDYCRNNNLTFIAYSPLDQGRIGRERTQLELIESLARKYNKSPIQIALNWITAHQPVVAIPSSFNPKHILENAEAVNFEMTVEDFDNIAQMFHNSPTLLSVDRIWVGGEMRTVEDALANLAGHSPSPGSLARDLSEGGKMKPIRVRKADSKHKYFDYELVDGRVRYWAWRIAFNRRPIPAQVRPE